MKKSLLFNSTINTRFFVYINTEYCAHAHVQALWCVEESCTRRKFAAARFCGLIPDILEFHEQRGEHRRSDHKFRFPSRRETIRFHLAIYIRATVTYVRQIEPENRAHVSWRSREAPPASRGCLGHLSFFDQPVVASIVYLTFGYIESLFIQG